MTEDELATVLGQISFVGVVALDELLSAGSERGSGATVGDTIAGGGHDPVEAFESEEMRQVLADAINRMPDRERLVLTLYYYEGLTLAEIGNVLNVRQIHTRRSSSCAHDPLRAEYCQVRSLAAAGAAPHRAEPYR